MHLLAATPGALNDGSEAVDLGQTPADVVVISAADTELSSLAKAHEVLRQDNPDLPSLRLANFMQLGHPMSVDLYIEDIVRHAKLVMVRLLGGTGYWTYGIEQVTDCCRRHGIALAVVPGDDQPDAELTGLSTLSEENCHRLWQYCVHGGGANYRNLLRYFGSLLGRDQVWAEPAPLLRAGLYWPGTDLPDLDTVREDWQDGAPVSAIVFYRALFQANNLAPVDALIDALRSRGINPLPIYVSSLKDPVVAETVSGLLDETAPGAILNATGFAISSPGTARKETPFDGADCPVIQVVFSGGNEESWRDATHGLSARDIAMNVALPEVDGRILSRAVSFKDEARYDEATQTSIVAYKAVPDRVAFVAEMTRNWITLRETEPCDRRVALILANYPNKDGRLGNGVGLDTPAGAINILKAMRAAGYDTGTVPADGNALVARIQTGPTNSGIAGRVVEETLSRAEYELFFAGLPDQVRTAVSERWGAPDDDPYFRSGSVDCGDFALPVFRLGNTVIGLQPARGYNIDPVTSYHDPDLPPPHGYLAFYAWLRLHFRAHAVVHVGKHGNMEWLPGKAVALSSACFPEAVFGPTPHLYPFIVNDPGEGTQAKRRAGAVIVDHLTPPLTRAETYGPLADLELLVDEYFEAAGVDPRRLTILREQILELVQTLGLDKDCGISERDDKESSLTKLDAYLCELKELQIRDGLHIFGDSPKGTQLIDLLVALVRVPRGDGQAGDASLHRALAADLGLAENGFDPLDCAMADPWNGPRPPALADTTSWRTNGDTVERIEILAHDIVAGRHEPDPAWVRAHKVLEALNETVRPSVTASGASELDGLLKGLNGRFVEPGASGAPTRGRLDVLPTGRNFYSVDSRTVPTPAAWTLGWKSADLLITRYRQEHGAWPRSMVISAWGTSNMRTGGDDIAQALALMGARPTWDSASRRVTGFEIIPLETLDRPRIDVTLRISGFFRDAFPAQIALFDSAARAVGALDEDARANPLAARRREERAQLVAQGLTEEDADAKAGYRVFGSKPGAYGAGLQALIDERGWQDDGDLARAYVAWGGYAYGAHSEGQAEHGLFERRLTAIDAVVHNQDNREHDLLDSDDYYQFEGGVTAAIRHLKGAQPPVYHNDHSRPESPKVRRLEEEIARIVRARVVNPKWIDGVMRHGYKGAFEMAATVDYLFAFAATAHAVGDHHFDAVFEAYLEDDRVREFLAENNPAALQEMAERLLEALNRGLWRPRSNSAHAHLVQMACENENESEKTTMEAVS